MPLTLSAALRSVVGAHRSGNEDSAACSARFALVADGVGGHAGGEVASGTVAQRLVSLLAADDAAGPDDLRAAVAAANADLALRADAEPALTGMATTLTGIVCAADGLLVLHIGDSRAYRWRDGAGRRVTRDDSLVQLLVDEGVIDPAEADRHPRRNVILHCLAGDPADSAHVTVVEADARPGDRWLLTTDGLTDYVAEDRVLALLADAPDPEEAAEALVAAALAADAWDNVTVVVADVRADGSARGVPAQVAGAAADEPVRLLLDPPA